MKPLKLTIEGLHSFKEKQEVDFTRLTETGLFGIFGATGSGKSSLLDAMTLALYGSVKRAALNTQGILNSQKDKLEVAFTFAIGIGGDRKTYRVERGYRRNKDRQSSVIPKGCRLMELQTGGDIVVADGQTEVNRKVMEIIGLNMADFTRSVVLPQGEFAQFLKLRDAERDQMIERIFALAEYGSKLTEKVKNERNRLESELEQVEGVLKGIGDVSHGQITGIQAELAAKKAEQQMVAEEYQKAEKAYEQAVAVWKLQENLAEAENEQEKLLQSQQMMNLKKIMQRKAEAAQRIKPYDEARQKAEAAYQSSRDQLRKSCGELEISQKDHQMITMEKSRIEAEFEEKQPGLIALGTRLQGLLDDEHIVNEKTTQKVALVSHLAEIRLRMDDIQERLQKGEAYKIEKEAERKKIEIAISDLTIDALTREKILTGVGLEEEDQRNRLAWDKLIKSLQDETTRRENLAAKFKEVETAQNALSEKNRLMKEALEQHLSLKPGDISGFNEQNELLRRLEQQASTLVRLDHEIQEESNESLKITLALKNRDKLIAQDSQAVDLIREKIGELEARHEEVTLYLKKMETANFAAVLAAGLAEDFPCPVCGAVHHPALAQKYEPAALGAKQNECQELASQLTLAKEKLDALSKEIIRNQTARETEILLQQSCQEKIGVKEESLRQVTNELSPAFRDLSRAKLQESIEQSKKNQQALIQAIEQWEREEKELTKKLEKLAAEKNQRDAEMGNLSGQLKVGEYNLAKIKEEYEERGRMLAETEERYRSFQQTLQIFNFQERQTQILHQDRQRDGYQEQLKSTVQLLEKAETRLSGLKQELDEVSSAAKELIATDLNLEKEIGEGKTKIAAVVGDRSVRTVLAETEGMIAALRQKVDEMIKLFAASQEKLNQLVSQNSADQRQTDNAKIGFENSSQEVCAKLEENGFFDLAEYRESLREQNERDELNKTIQDFEDHWKRIQTRIQDILMKLGGEKLLAADWERIIQTKEERAAQKELIAGEIGGMEMNLQKMESQYHNLQQYLEEKHRIAAKKEMADEIAKLLQGNAFVAYIAEEHMRYILDDASRRLEALTYGRYMLKMDEKKDFIICDNGNGGLTRPATSLSGGETFLVSLSLALALSSKIQLGGRNPLEFFFLDEGFGTLDPRLLDTVMDSLEKLQKESFTIGIISHVPELRERISRRLLVTPAGLNGEGSRVRVDIA